MYNLTHQNGRVAYGLKKFIVNTVSDIEKIPTTSLLPGSTAFIPKSSELYIYQENNTWVKIKSKSSGNAGGDTPSGDNTYIWDGGSIDGTSNANTYIWDGGNIG